MPHHVLQSFRIEIRIGITENHNRGFDKFHHAVYGVDFSFALRFVKKMNGLELPHYFRRAVGRAIGCYENRKFVCRVIQGQRIYDFLRDEILFIECRDEHGKRREFVAGRGQEGMWPAYYFR